MNSNGDFLVKDKYLLSLKDFNASKHVEKLISYGVKSFKIEGRLKDINYVKNVTLFYNNLIRKFAQKTSSGIVISDFEPDLYKTFNRSFTDYFLKSRSKCYNLLTPKSMGEETGKITKVTNNYFECTGELNPQDGIFFINKDEVLGCLINKVEGRKIYPNKMPKISVGNTIYRNFNSAFDKILSNSKTVRKIGVKISIKDSILTATDEDNNNISIKIEQKELAQNQEKARQNYIKQISKTGNSDFYIIDINIEDKNLPFVPLSELNNLRRNLFEKLMELRINNYAKTVQKPISYAQYPILNLDYRANIFNEEAKQFYEKSGCKIEQMALENYKKIPSNTELMRTKHCIKYALGQCSKDLGVLFLVDEKGKKYPLKFDCKNCEMAILAP